MEISPPSDPGARLFKGLADAKNRVDQTTQEDSAAPDLAERLDTQAEPQNYFFEPYASQWTPQVAKKGALLPLPGVVAAALDDVQTLSLSGLLPEIRAAWTSVDSRLFLWSYAQRGRFAAVEFDQAVVAVGLVTRPARGVFTAKVKHVLVVATTVEVVLLAVVADDQTTELTGGGFKLQRTKLSVSTDKCVVRHVATTRAGRIFFGGSDGALYEFLYAPAQHAAADRSTLLTAALSSVPGVASVVRAAAPPCRKVAHTSSLVHYLPRFLSGLAAAPGPIRAMCVDDTRHILYVLQADAQVSVFDLGPRGGGLTPVCSADLLADGAKYARENRRTRVSCPDERLFQANGPQLVSLAVVPPDESKLVTLVAVTATGIRFYLSVFSRRATYTPASARNKPKRPTRLEIVHIRLPPPAIALRDAPPYHAKEGMQPGYAPGKSPSAVRVALHRQGVFLCVEGRRDGPDQLVGIAQDPIRPTALPAGVATRKPSIREAVSLADCLGKVVDLRELSSDSSEGSERDWRTMTPATSESGGKRTFDEMSSGVQQSSKTTVDATEDITAAPIVDELALMYSQPARHFVCLTSAGIQVFKKIRPLDQLHRVLLLARGHELKAALAPFARCFGEVQLCCMLLALACGVPTDPLVSEGASAASLVGPRAGAGRLQSDEYVYTAAVQGVFECSQGLPDAGAMEQQSAAGAAAPAASSTRIVLTTEFGMSYQHDGLVAFACRVLRPLWTAKTLGRRVAIPPASAKAPPAAPTFENVHSAEKLDEIREILFQLRQLMESAGPFAVAISGGAALEKNPRLDGGAWDDVGGDISRVSELVMRHQKARSEEQLQREARFKAEQRSLYFLYQLVLRSIESISLLRLALEYKTALEEPLARLSFSELAATTEGALAAKSMTKVLLRGRNEHNQFLLKQLREQCPSFFSVADLWHYQGYRSLASAKLSGSPVARQSFLQESLAQFLTSCHMWDTPDCVAVLQGICEDYALLNFYEGVVKLALACAKHFHDAAASDLSGVKLTWKRQCFGCILLALQRLLRSDKKDAATGRGATGSPQAVEDMVTLDDETRSKCVEELFHFALACEDDAFHELLYTWLYENGHAAMLPSIRSPFIEDFLKETDQDLLVKLYMDQHKYLVAAKVWWARAHEDAVGDEEDAATLVAAGNPDVVKRQYFVAKSLGCLKSLEDVGEAAEAIREVRDVLDVLQLQVRVLKALEQQTLELEASSTTSTAADDELRERKRDVQLLTFKLFDASTLYNRFASKYDLWAECLHIIHACKSEEPAVIAGLWRKILLSLLPASSSSSEFNAWRADQCEQAGLVATASSSSGGGSSFESGLWIGQLQGKLLRLGKALYLEGDDAHGGSATGVGGFVFPVGFLAKLLERISLWYLRLTGLSAFSGSAAIDATTFNWVLKLLLDVGVPHRVLLSYYEQLYREQGSLSWTLHLLQAMLTIVTLWKKHAISPRAGKDQLAEFAACCPHVVDLSDDFITDLRAIPLGTRPTHWVFSL
ncbi:hypothetical protein BBJ28_00005374 [Nothophytophthora sp. Chile5]|nr:hypothetical protein BBJ28_00005374 [Nothophytophthora sp. Chile5]